MLFAVLSFSLFAEPFEGALVWSKSSLWSWFCYVLVSSDSLEIISVLFLRPQVLIISLALRSRSVFVTSLCFSRICIFLAASVAYSLPQLYRHGNSFFSSLAHRRTCFFLWFSRRYICISKFCMRLFIKLWREWSRESLSESELLSSFSRMCDIHILEPLVWSKKVSLDLEWAIFWLVSIRLWYGFSEWLSQFTLFDYSGWLLCDSFILLWLRDSSFSDWSSFLLAMSCGINVLNISFVL